MILSCFGEVEYDGIPLYHDLSTTSPYPSTTTTISTTPPPQPVQLRHPYTPSLSPPSLPTCHPYNPYHLPLPFFTPPQFFWPTFGQGPPPLPLIPVLIASHNDTASHPSTLQTKPTATPTQPPKSQQPKHKTQSGVREDFSCFSY